MDLPGIALIITAVTAMITSLAGIGFQIAASRRLDKLTTETVKLHDSVNGQTREVRDLADKVSRKEGEEAGIAAERANPMVPKTA